jgi:hypothetical protein
MIVGFSIATLILLGMPYYASWIERAQRVDQIKD